MRAQVGARRRHGGQTTVEFAAVAGIMFLAILGVIGVSLWAIEEMAAVNAAETAAQLAVAAQPTDLGQPDWQGAATAVVPRLRQSMFGANVAATTMDACNPPGNSVYVCSGYTPGASPGTAGTISVRVYGTPTNFTGIFGLGTITINVGTQVRAEVFQR